MNNSDRLRKALDIIALNHSEGKVSNDTLIKACDTYKQKIGFVDDFDYEMIISPKSAKYNPEYLTRSALSLYDRFVI